MAEQLAVTWREAGTVTPGMWIRPEATDDGTWVQIEAVHGDQKIAGTAHVNIRFVDGNHAFVPADDLIATRTATEMARAKAVIA